MLVGVGDALVILFAVFVDVSVGIGIAAEPELFDELFALVIGLQRLEGFALLVGDDPAHVFVEPAFVNALDLLLLALSAFFFSTLVFFLFVLLFVLSESGAIRDGEARDDQSESQKQRRLARGFPCEK